MVPILSLAEVFNALQKAKAGASAFCTNFFPHQRKLQDWISHAELLGELSAGTALFLRRDRNFWRLYFSATDVKALQRVVTASPMLRTEPIVTDLVGDEAALGGLLAGFESAGFRRYNHLYRMARLTQTTAVPGGSNDTRVDFAEIIDARAILDLLDRSFDPYAEQLPTLYEVEAATTQRQVLALKHDGKLAGLLWFETQGLTSTVRYWLVAGPYRAQQFGAALMRRYFATHSAVRRFSLWVIADNENAISKYRHYGFTPDGLADHVLANAMIRP